MRRFLSNLFRDFRTTSSARDRRRAPRRATLQVEGLEDRLVMTASHLGSSLLANAGQVSSIVSQTQPIVRTSPPPATTTTASQNGSILTIVAAAGQDTFIQSDGAGHIDVDGLGEQPQVFTISSINSVNITGLGNQSSESVVIVDDSNGMPFAPGTTISLSGSGTPLSNLLSLGGSRTLGTNETYVPGSISILHLGGPGGPSIIHNSPATLSLNNLNIQFVLSSSFGGVIADGLPITGTLDVQASGTQVQLGSDGFSGLGNGAGSGLVYSGKLSVTLDTSAPNASIFLDDADAPAGESYFTVNMHAAGETTTLDQTPKSVWTIVNVDPPATNASVAVWGNFGQVTIDGDSSTRVNIGYPLASTGTITSGILANVTVEGASSLVVNNSGNRSTFENVTVTNQTISGSGLFGNNGVTLEYGGVQAVEILTGQLADGYTVSGQFTSNITILSNSYMAFHVNVDVGSASHLNLTLDNLHPQIGVLDVSLSSFGIVDFSGTLPNGTVDAFFVGHPFSQISYNGFADVF